MRALQFAQDRLAMGGSRSIQRPLTLTVLMWACVIGVFAAIICIGGMAAGFLSPSISSISVTREEWMQISAPLLAASAALMALTAIGLRSRRPWARWTCMAIWPLIIATAIGEAGKELIPWWLARRAIIEAAIIGTLLAWILFRSRGSVLYFYRIRQGRGGSSSRR